MEYTTDDYYCPVCGGQLLEDDTSNTEYCADNPDHYRQVISAEEMEQAG